MSDQVRLRADLMPAWEVTIFGLATSMPFVAARVGWLKSSAHPVRTFRTLDAAQRYIAKVEAQARWSLISIKWKGEILETTRPRDWLDKLASFFGVA